MAQGHQKVKLSARRHHKATVVLLFATRLDAQGKLPMSIVHSRPTPQTNWNDCGVYAAAYATEMASGSGIPGLQAPYDVASIREVFGEVFGAGRYDAISSYRDATRAHGKRR